ncbi:Yip1 domain-containing protein [Planoprotostelium fungivorum]|uniref:Protein YIPF n=1 Tax=Planoprotostelium fungivorum TaxID=1890364 RepID=A0A2P6NI99_9EUKA|nr:Yip1 domain-containing protein [Planoprotostelium fungivorum]
MSSTIDFFPSEYSVNTAGPENAFSTPYSGNMAFSGNMNYGSTSTGFEDEPPLWEELGFDPVFIKTKLVQLLTPRKSIEPRILHDEDLGGPFIFCLALAFSLVLQGGKLHFGYIFGYSFLGSLALYFLVNLLSDRPIGFSHTMSILGYCLTPMILLSFTSLIFHPSEIVGFLIATSIILFCTYSASSAFVRVMGTTDQKFLLAYPVGLIYWCFALIVMF